MLVRRLVLQSIVAITVVAIFAVVAVGSYRGFAESQDFYPTEHIGGWARFNNLGEAEQYMGGMIQSVGGFLASRLSRGLAAAPGGPVSARYEYGPFGEPIRVTGPAAGPSPFRFSTKRTDSTTDLVLYEYRLYNPSLGRWLSRDPMWELGFTFGTTGERLGRAQDFDEDEEPRIRLPHQETESLYGFVVNAPINHVDPLGLISFNQCFEDQIMQLRQAWEEMCSLLRDPKFRCCVGRSQLLQMFERRCSWGNVKFKCRRNDQGLCPWACAHAWQSLGVGRGVIVVCDRQFYNPFECRLSLKCVLAHEMTHILGGTPFDHGVVEKVTKCCVNN